MRGTLELGRTGNIELPKGEVDERSSDQIKPIETSADLQTLAREHQNKVNDLAARAESLTAQRIGVVEKVGGDLGADQASREAVSAELSIANAQMIEKRQLALQRLDQLSTQMGPGAAAMISEMRAALKSDIQKLGGTVEGDKSVVDEEIPLETVAEVPSDAEMAISTVDSESGDLAQPSEQEQLIESLGAQLAKAKDDLSKELNHSNPDYQYHIPYAQRRCGEIRHQLINLQLEAKLGESDGSESSRDLVIADFIRGEQKQNAISGADSLIFGAQKGIEGIQTEITRYQGLIEKKRAEADQISQSVIELRKQLQLDPNNSQVQQELARQRQHYRDANTEYSQLGDKFDKLQGDAPGKIAQFQQQKVQGEAQKKAVIEQPELYNKVPGRVEDDPDYAECMAAAEFSSSDDSTLYNQRLGIDTQKVATEIFARRFPAKYAFYQRRNILAEQSLTQVANEPSHKPENKQLNRLEDDLPVYSDVDWDDSTRYRDEGDAHIANQDQSVISNALRTPEAQEAIDTGNIGIDATGESIDHGSLTERFVGYVGDQNFDIKQLSDAGFLQKALGLPQGFTLEELDERAKDAINLNGPVVRDSKRYDEMLREIETGLAELKTQADLMVDGSETDGGGSEGEKIMKGEIGDSLTADGEEQQKPTLDGGNDRSEEFMPRESAAFDLEKYEQEKNKLESLILGAEVLDLNDPTMVVMQPALKVLKNSFNGNAQEMAGYLIQLVKSFKEQTSPSDSKGENDFVAKLMKEASPNGPDGREDLLGRGLCALRNKDYADLPDFAKKKEEIDETKSLTAMLRYLAQKM